MLRCLGKMKRAGPILHIMIANWPGPKSTVQLPDNGTSSLCTCNGEGGKDFMVNKYLNKLL